jgi:hypothetical protein
MIFAVQNKIGSKIYGKRLLYVIFKMTSYSHTCWSYFGWQMRTLSQGKGK